MCVENRGRFTLEADKLKLQDSSLAGAAHGSEHPPWVREEAAVPQGGAGRVGVLQRGLPSGGDQHYLHARSPAP